MIYRIPRAGKKPPQPLQVSTLKEQGWSEKDLENYLFKNLPSLVGPDLFVIGQSSPWQPEVDLLALDCEGNLWFFELKAVTSSSDNLLQVLGYSQTYSQLSLDDLSTIFEKYSGDSTRSLPVAFCSYFGYSAPSAVQEWAERIGRKHHLLVVTDGADDETIAAVNHWQRHGLDIDVWPWTVNGGRHEEVVHGHRGVEVILVEAPEKGTRVEWGYSPWRGDGPILEEETDGKEGFDSGRRGGAFYSVCGPSVKEVEEVFLKVGAE